MGEEVPEDLRGVPRQPGCVALGPLDGARDVVEDVLARREVDLAIGVPLVCRVEQCLGGEEADVSRSDEGDGFPAGHVEQHAHGYEPGETAFDGEVVLGVGVSLVPSESG